MKRSILRVFASATAWRLATGKSSSASLMGTQKNLPRVRPGARLSAFVLGVAVSSLVTPRAQAQQAAPALTPEAAVVAYCAAWSTADRAARERLLDQSWTPDGVYIDPDPTLASGRAALSDTIGTFLDHHRGAYFRCSAPQVHHGAMRVTWTLFGPDGVALGHGTDFSELAADGRIRRVVGFFGDPPVVKP